MEADPISNISMCPCRVRELPVSLAESAAVKGTLTQCCGCLVVYTQGSQEQRVKLFKRPVQPERSWERRDVVQDVGAGSSWDCCVLLLPPDALVHKVGVRIPAREAYSPS